MVTENQKNFRFKVGDSVFCPNLDNHELVTIETVDTNDNDLTYRIEFDNGYLWWVHDYELVTKEVYESPLYKIMRENDE